MSKRDLSQLVRSSLLDEREQYLDDSSHQVSWQEGTHRIKNAKWIPIKKIHPDPDQPRKSFNPESIHELADSIKEHGILQPLVVEYKSDQDAYIILHGERRYRAGRQLLLQELPCIVQEHINNDTRFAQQLVENIQREDLTPIDKARALLELKSLHKDGNWSDVEKQVGISETRRKQFVALLKLPEHIQKKIVSLGKRPGNHQITEKHARALILLKKQPDKQQQLFECLLDSNNYISGEEAIDKAKSLKGEKKFQTFRVQYLSKRELIEKLEQKITELKGEGAPG